MYKTEKPVENCTDPTGSETKFFFDHSKKNLTVL